MGTNTTSKEEFLRHARFLHDNFYTYEKMLYVNLTTKIVITCPLHGDFVQKPTKHKRGQGCGQCGMDKNAEKKRTGTAAFIKASNKLFGEGTYAYGDVVYKNNRTKVSIGCLVNGHGTFMKTPYKHLKGQGCPICSKIASSKKQRLAQKDFIQKANKKHEGRYSYPHSKYKTGKCDVIMTCLIHGEFKQKACSHLQGRGCKHCNSKSPSKQELTILKFVRDELMMQTITSDRKILGGRLELDLVIPSKNIAIEYNGVAWHSTKFKQDRRYHFKKTQLAQQKGYRLIHIFEDEWQFRRPQVEAFLRATLGKNQKTIGARKTTFTQINKNVAQDFIERYHIQGLKSACPYNYGLYDTEGRLVMVMSFAPHHRKGGKECLTLRRMCSLARTTVQGGASKLLKYALIDLKTFYPDLQTMVSWSDNRWSEGRVYEMMGFAHAANLPPDYSYVKGQRRLSKQSHQKKKIGCPPERTEEEYCKNELGLYRIYDCGKKRWELEV